MKKWIPILVSACLLITALIGCKPKTENENMTFAATITDIEEDGTLVETSANVGFTTALVHLAEGYEPDFTLKFGQTVQLTILPMMTKSIPPQVTAVAVALISEPTDGGVASVTDGLDPMPMLTPGTEPVTDADAPDTLEAHMADMLPVLDALSRTMGMRGERSYMPADAVFVWDVLARLADDWGHTVPETVREDEAVVVPESAMRAFALAAFNRTEALPPLPETVVGRVTYDEARSAYRVVNEKPENDSATGIDTFADNGDGTYSAVLGWYSATGERLGGMRFTLKDASMENGAYRFVVTGAAAEKA